MISTKSMLGMLAAAGLIVAACAAEPGESPGWTSGVEESPGLESPGMESPGLESPGMESPGTEESPGTGSNTGTSPSPDTGTGAAESPSPGTGTGASPSPGTGVGEGPVMGALGAVAVVDLDGSITVLDGECSWTGGTAGQTIAGQPGDGSVVTLTFEQGTDASMTLSIELSRGFPEPAEPEAGASPSPGTGTGTGERPMTAEDVLPFTVLPEQVQVSLQVGGQDVGQPQVRTGTVAPNGLSGYMVSQTEQGQLLTINFLCAQTSEGGAEGPGMSPAPTGTPGTEASPTPTP